MKVETLVATVENNPQELVESMKLENNVIISAQNGRNRISDYVSKKVSATIYEIVGKGVSINRNLLLMQSNADILIFADDDLVFRDEYTQIVRRIYDKYQADIILFNLGEFEDSPINTYKVKKINKLNYQKYGGARFTAKRSSLIKHGLFFNVSFGGGSEFGSGEDTMFLKDALDAGLKIIIVPEYLAELANNSRTSTWFSGYDKKYFRDKGYLLQALHNNFAYIVIVRFLMKHLIRDKMDVSFFEAYKSMRKGQKEYICDNI